MHTPERATNGELQEGQQHFTNYFTGMPVPRMINPVHANYTMVHALIFFFPTHFFFNKLLDSSASRDELETKVLSKEEREEFFLSLIPTIENMCSAWLKTNEIKILNVKKKLSVSSFVYLLCRCSLL